MDRNVQIAREAKLRQINAALDIALRQAQAHQNRLQELQRLVTEMTRLERPGLKAAGVVDCDHFTVSDPAVLPMTPPAMGLGVTIRGGLVDK